MSTIIVNKWLTERIENSNKLVAESRENVRRKIKRRCLISAGISVQKFNEAALYLSLVVFSFIFVENKKWKEKHDVSSTENLVQCDEKEVCI